MSWWSAVGWSVRRSPTSWSTAGATTVLVDRHDPGRATDAGAGILSPETGQDPDPDTFAFARSAALHYEALIDRLRDDGIADTGFAVTGSLLIAERPGDDEFMERAAGLIERPFSRRGRGDRPGRGVPLLPAARPCPSGPVQPRRHGGSTAGS